MTLRVLSSRTTPSLVVSQQTHPKPTRPKVRTRTMQLSSQFPCLHQFAVVYICNRIGIAIGPRTWFAGEYGNNVSTSGTVINNQFTGAFSYAIAMSSAVNFTVENNVLIGNTTFIGAIGPNCSTDGTMPNPSAFVIDQNNVQSSITQFDFQPISNGDGLTCVMPPAGGDFWPFGGNPGASSQNPPVPIPEPNSPNSSSSSASLTAGQKGGIAVGVIGGLLFVALATWFIRRRALQRSLSRRAYSSSLRPQYLGKL